MTRWLMVLALASVAGICVGTPARAGLLPVQVSVSPESGNYRWTYAILLQAGSQLQSGDYFTVYDFAGLVSGSVVAPDGWTVSVENLGTTPGRVSPDDNATLPNLTFRYGGPTLNVGQTGLGNFWAVSAYQDPTDSFLTAQTHRTSDGKPDSNITETVVPVPCAPPGVPEPATLVMAGLGLPLVGVARLFRRRSR